MTVKRAVSLQIFGYRLVGRGKSSVIYIILFALLIIFMFADNIISNISLHSAAFTKKEDSEVLQTPKAIRKLKTDATPVPFNISTQKKIIKVDSENQNLLVSSSGVREEQRIGRFSRKLAEYEIFKSDDLTKKFHGRVLEFFNQKCEVHFFMTWISTAVSFGRREILGVESVFKAHPHGCLMILSRTMDSAQGYRILQPLLDRGFKVLAVTPDFPFLLKNTPAEAWFDDMKGGKKDPGEIPLAQNLSNLMRLSVLYKYGGVYLDTDFIVLKSFRGLKNTIGAQSINTVSKKWTRLNNAVLIFDMNHPLLFKFIEEFALTFDGNKWGHNGPYLVSRVVHRVEGRPGYNFTVLPPMAFYPVDWTKVGSLFKMPKDRADSRWVEAKLQQLNGQSYGVHLWNKQSSKLVVEEGSIMGRLISENCVLCKHIYGS
ncbi:lactosylceramide 4-alpha-galactosyltransferase-like [Durio zibethinus]|uniref:Lactosylceramide 4-alpha-galactosyltransferase-like n=1 Tax=Durio zibethinus TaxID=66656 RepID=A0A6P6AN53_DURZI|nr:lactosylceramide 4-alpha-galactosyltransferase-like [Durio zibethinus]